MSDKELRELDLWTAEHVMMWKLSRDKETFIEPSCPLGMNYPSEWCPTTDPAAAMEVLKKCYDKCRMSISSCKTPSGFKLWLPNNYASAIERNTLELAICLFAKKLFQ